MRIYLISHTESNGNRVTNQRYSTDQVTRRLQDLEEWGCYDIEIVEEKPTR